MVGVNIWCTRRTCWVTHTLTSLIVYRTRLCVREHYKTRLCVRDPAYMPGKRYNFAMGGSPTKNLKVALVLHLERWSNQSPSKAIKSKVWLDGQFKGSPFVSLSLIWNGLHEFSLYHPIPYFVATLSFSLIC